MIGKLRGIIEEVGPDWLIIDVNGVGYHVTCSRRTLDAIGPSGSETRLAIETRVSADAIRLIGFAGELERDWFRLLLGVQGVGTRVALGILGTLAPSDLGRAIALEDKKAVASAPGVGPKVAARIVSELKDKVPQSLSLAATLDNVAAMPAAQGGVSMRDAVSALTNLGYPQAQAMGAVSAAAKSLDDDATAEQLIRQGLKELTR